MIETLFINMLLLALGGCATSAPHPSRHSALLNFTDLAAEITVQHEVTESRNQLQRFSKRMTKILLTSPKIARVVGLESNDFAAN